MHYLYVIESIKEQLLYIGITDDIKRRIWSHNKKLNISTKAYAPYKLLFFAGFPDKSKAAKFEKYLKTASGRAFLKKRLLQK